MKKITSYTTELEARRFIRKAFLKKIIEARKTELLRQSILAERKNKSVTSTDDDLSKYASDEDLGGSPEVQRGGERREDIELPGDPSEMSTLERTAHYTRSQAEAAGMMEKVAPIMETTALANYMMVSMDALAPFVNECHANTTWPVGPEDIINLLADLYAFVSADTTHLRYTKTAAGIYAEQNEDMYEFLVNTFNPADPINLAGLVLAPFTSGVSLGVAAGVSAGRKVGSEAAEASLRQLARSAVRRELARNADDAAGEALKNQAQAAARRTARETIEAAPEQLGKETKGWFDRIRGGSKDGLVDGKYARILRREIGPSGAGRGRGQFFEQLDELVDTPGITSPEGFARAASDPDFLAKAIRKPDNMTDADFKSMIDDMSIQLPRNPVWKDMTSNYYRSVKNLEVEQGFINSRWTKTLGETGIPGTKRLANSKTFEGSKRLVSKVLAGTNGAWPGLGGSIEYLTGALTRLIPGAKMPSGLLKKNAERMAADIHADIVNVGEVTESFVEKLSREVPERVAIDQAGDAASILLRQSPVGKVMLDAGEDGAEGLAKRLKERFIVDKDFFKNVDPDSLFKIDPDGTITIDGDLMDDLLGTPGRTKGMVDAGEIDSLVIDPSDFPGSVRDPAYVAIREQAEGAKEFLTAQKQQAVNYMRVEDEILEAVLESNQREYTRTATRTLLFVNTVSRPGSSNSLLGSHTRAFVRAESQPGVVDGSGGAGSASAMAAELAEIEELEREEIRLAEEKRKVEEEFEQGFDDILALSSADIDELSAQLDAQEEKLEAETAEAVAAADATGTETGDPIDSSTGQLDDSTGGSSEEALSTSAALQKMADEAESQIYGIGAGDGFFQGLNGFLNSYDSYLNSWNSMKTRTQRLAGILTQGDYKEMHDDIEKINWIGEGFGIPVADGLARGAEKLVGAVGWLVDFVVPGEQDIGERDGFGLDWTAKELHSVQALILTVLNQMGKIGEKSYTKTQAMAQIARAWQSDFVSAEPSKQAKIKQICSEAVSGGVVNACDFTSVDTAWDMYKETTATVQEGGFAVINPRLQALDESKSLKEADIRKAIRKVLRASKDYQKKKLNENSDVESNSSLASQVKIACPGSKLSPPTHYIARSGGGPYGSQVCTVLPDDADLSQYIKDDKGFTVEKGSDLAQGTFGSGGPVRDPSGPATESTGAESEEAFLSLQSQLFKSFSDKSANKVGNSKSINQIQEFFEAPQKFSGGDNYTKHIRRWWLANAKVIPGRYAPVASAEREVTVPGTASAGNPGQKVKKRYIAPEDEISNYPKVGSPSDKKLVATLWIWRHKEGDFSLEKAFTLPLLGNSSFLPAWFRRDFLAPLGNEKGKGIYLMTKSTGEDLPAGADRPASAEPWPGMTVPDVKAREYDEEKFRQVWESRSSLPGAKERGKVILQAITNEFKSKVESGWNPDSSKGAEIIPFIGIAWTSGDVGGEAASKAWNVPMTTDVTGMVNAYFEAGKAFDDEFAKRGSLPMINFKRGVDNHMGIISPIYVNAESGSGARESLTNEVYGELAEAIKAKLPQDFKPIDEEYEGSVSDTGIEGEESDSDTEDSDDDTGGLFGGVKKLSPEEAREEFIEFFQNRDQNKSGMMVINKPSKGRRMINNYMLEFAIAGYIVKHGLESRLQSLAPTFWEGFYTSYQRGKGAKINQTIGDWPELDAAFDMILTHAKAKGEGIMSDPKVKAIVSGGGNDWRTINQALNGLGYTQYVDGTYLDGGESDFFGWATFMRDLANGVTVSPATVIPESVRRRKVMTSKAFKSRKK